MTRRHRPHSRPWGLAASALVVFLLVTLGALARPVGAAPPDDCPIGETQGGPVCMVWFGYTGGPQVFTVPEGVHRLHLSILGAPSGSGFDSYYPDHLDPRRRSENLRPVSVVVAVHPGERLVLIVGGAGANAREGTAEGVVTIPGGYGGGGDGCAMTYRFRGELHTTGSGSTGGGTFVFHDDPDRTLVAGDSGYPNPGHESFQYGSSYLINGPNPDATLDGPGVGGDGPFDGNPAFPGIYGNPGSPTRVALNADHTLSAMKGGNAICTGGDPYDRATADGDGLAWMASGAGGGGIYGGGSGGGQTLSMRPITRLPIRTWVGSGGGGSSGVLEGVPIDHTPGWMNIDVNDEGAPNGIVMIGYPPLRSTPTTTTTPTTTPPATPTTTTPPTSPSAVPAPVASIPATDRRVLARTGPSTTTTEAGIGATLIALGTTCLALRRRRLRH